MLNTHTCAHTLWVVSKSLIATTPMGEFRGDKVKAAAF